MSVEAAKDVFFDAEHYAIVGASKDPSKFGNKVSMDGFTFYRWPGETYEVLRWYKDHGLDAIPVHPRESSIEELPTIASVFDIHEPKATSLSIITPPKVTLPIIKTALLELGVNAIWLQPGAEDQEVKDWVESLDESVKTKVIYGGPCILVLGEKLAQAKGKL